MSKKNITALDAGALRVERELACDEMAFAGNRPRG